MLGYAFTSVSTIFGFDFRSVPTGCIFSFILFISTTHKLFLSHLLIYIAPIEIKIVFFQTSVRLTIGYLKR